MKRGPVSLSDQEVKLIQSLLSPFDAPIRYKLESALADTLGDANLELSEQELELIMDALPVPGESEELDILRLKLRQAFDRISLELADTPS